jgi:glycosyltransferase involved in cell wall biosynthesis
MDENETPIFTGRLGLQQRVLPDYRSPFFQALAATCSDGLSIFAGLPHPDEAITPIQHIPSVKLAQAQNLHLGKPPSTYFICWQNGILRWLSYWQPDALVVEANPRYLSTRLAVRWMHARRRPVLGWGLGAPPLSGKFANLRQRQRLSLLLSLDGLIAYSHRGGLEYQRQGIPEEKIFIATNAVTPPPTVFPPHRPDHPQHPPTVLFVGRLQARKRIDLLLQACANLPADIQPQLWIIGDGPTRPDLERLAKQVYPTAQFLGARHGAELQSFFEKADLFVLPGTGGLAVQQAMAHGLPVIVAEGDGTQDDLVRAANGWQVHHGDLNDLTSTLKTALEDIPTLRRMGLESYRIVAEEINTDSMVSSFMHALAAISNQSDQY